MGIDPISRIYGTTREYHPGGEASRAMNTPPEKLEEQVARDAQRNSLPITSEELAAEDSAAEDSEQGGVVIRKTIVTRGKDGRVYETKAMVHEKGLPEGGMGIDLLAWFLIMNNVRVYRKDKHSFEISYSFYEGGSGVRSGGGRMGEVRNTIRGLLDEYNLTRGTLFLSGVGIARKGEKTVGRKFIRKLRKRLDSKVSLDVIVI